MLEYSICAFLAPALISAAAFPWTGPDPTLIIPEQDSWSPSVTDAPESGPLELFKRNDDNTCGFLTGDPSRSFTCNNPNYICATNSYYGVHGCCDPASILSCSIPTTCIPSTALSASCTGTCSANSYIQKCTLANAPNCVELRYVYVSPSTIMTEYGCAASSGTTSVQRYASTTNSAATTTSPASSPSSSTTSSSTVTSSSSTEAAATSTSPSSSNTPLPIGAIVGGVVGGVAVLGAIAGGIIFLILRFRKQKESDLNVGSGATQPFIGDGDGTSGPAPGVTEYKPHSGFPTPSPSQYETGTSGYFSQQSLYSPITSPGLKEGNPLNPAEAGGTEIPAGKGGDVKQAQVGGIHEAPA